MSSSDALYAAVGRLLAVATGFESSARFLLDGLQIAETDEADLEELVLKQIRDGYRVPLERVLANIGSRVTTIPDLEATLRAARLARNEVAHRLTLGVDLDSKDPERRALLFAKIRELHQVLSEARWLVSVIGIVRRSGGKPTPDELEPYRNGVVRQLFELEYL